MPNGRNAGRLFPDCTGEHGYGRSHQVPHEAKVGDVVTCPSCGARLRIVAGSRVETVEVVEPDPAA